MFARRAAKGNIRTIGHVHGLGPLVQKIEHARAGGERCLQRRAQTAHRQHRAKGGQVRKGADERGREREVARGEKPQRRRDHGEAGEQHQRIRQALDRSGAHVQGTVRGAHGVGLRGEAGRALGDASELHGLGKAAQAIEYVRADGARRIARCPAGVSA